MRAHRGVPQPIGRTEAVSHSAGVAVAVAIGDMTVVAVGLACSAVADDSPGLSYLRCCRLC